jgi:hypothetical protein
VALYKLTWQEKKKKSYNIRNPVPKRRKIEIWDFGKYL